MKVLVKKLEYVRRILTNFWRDEAKKVCAAFGFKSPFYITFANQELGDEAAMKKLIEGMYDRHLISDETMREQMNFLSPMEDWRIKKEDKLRKSGRKPPMYSPYVNGNFDKEAKKIGLQQGLYNLEEIGVDTIKDAEILRPNRIEYATTLDIFKRTEINKLNSNNLPVDTTTPSTPIKPIIDTKTPKQPGRPQQSRDTTKRKEKQPGTMKRK